MNDNDNLDLLDARQCCALLRCCRRTFARMLARREFPAPIRVCRLRRWDRATVTRWFRAQESEMAGAAR